MAEEKIEESSFTQTVDKPVKPQEGENTSGMHSSVPPEIQGGWNWGAFFLTWVWGISHGVWIALLAFVVPLPIMEIILGAKGNEWAWQNRHFESVDQFQETQRKWGIWGLVIFIFLSLLMAGVIATAVFVSIDGAREKARQAKERQKQYDQIRKNRDDYYDDFFKELNNSTTNKL